MRAGTLATVSAADLSLQHGCYIFKFLNGFANNQQISIINTRIRMHAGSTDISPADAAAPTIFLYQGKTGSLLGSLESPDMCGNLIHRNTCCTAVQCNDSGTAAAVLTGIFTIFLLFVFR